MGIDPIAVVESLLNRFGERDVPIRRFRIMARKAPGREQVEIKYYET